MPRRHIAELTAEEIARIVKDAPKEAQANAHAHGVPYSTRIGERLFRIYPDGSREEIPLEEKSV